MMVGGKYEKGEKERNRERERYYVYWYCDRGFKNID